ncbi:MAG: hypothetical protein ABIO99_04270 [Candidatus Limnocylindria bacterium]
MPIDIGTDCARLAGMNDRDSIADRLSAHEGVDEAALGTDADATAASAPPGAEVADDEHLVPGAGASPIVPDQSNPWFTSLAAASDQAGVGNEPADPGEDR